MTTEVHVHRWLIEPGPDGTGEPRRTSGGVCKSCGETKAFANVADDIVAEKYRKKTALPMPLIGDRTAAVGHVWPVYPGSARG